MFGPGFVGHPADVNITELKKFSIPQRAKALEARLQEYFFKQVDVIGSNSPWAPFPLAVMTCVGIEMIGAFKYGDAFGDKNDHFKKIVEDMDGRLASVRTDPKGNLNKLSYFVYKGFRNSLAHGFYGKWVFITHDPGEAKRFRYVASKKILVLNVYWFYRRFKVVSHKYLNSLALATNPAKDPLKTFNETFKSNFSLWV